MKKSTVYWKEIIRASIPSNWEIITCEGSESSCIIGLGHNNPVLNANPILLGRKTISTKGNTTTTTQGSEIKSLQYKKQLDMMEQIPYPKVQEAVKKLKKSLEEATKAFPATMQATGLSEKYDYIFNLVIARAQDEKTAKTMLENYRDIPVQGLDYKLPEGMISGIEGQQSITKVLANPMVQEQMKKYVSKSEINKVVEQIQSVSAEAKEQMQEDNVRFVIEKYLGHNALRYAGKRYSGKEIVYLQIQCREYILSGEFTQMANIQKDGSTSCDSLTRYKTVETKSRIGNETFIDIELVPLESTYKAEGYLYREEMEGILKKTMKRIKE